MTSEEWSVLPGLLYAIVRERFPEKSSFPLANLPDQLRNSEPALVYKPLMQLLGDRFILQLGPRVVSLLTRGEYPGWNVIQDEMDWLVGRLNEAGFIAEGERLGMRYIDFFETNIFEHLVLGVQIEGEPETGPEMSLTRVFDREPFKARLLLNNGAMVKTDAGLKSGSVLDLDLWIGPGDFELFENGRERFAEAHRLNKEIFFGLLDPGFLSTFNPEINVGALQTLTSARSATA